MPMLDVVYAFVNTRNEVGYIGQAENLLNRQRGHEHRDAAMLQGYVRLYVHWQGPMDPIDFKEAEERLITAYCPPLNTHHNWLINK
jgi:excinuclease UvrABC nuclease subunit